MTNARRAPLLGLIVSATVLAVASAAFACTKYAGRSTVIPGLGSSGTAGSADGNGGHHGTCAATTGNISGPLAGGLATFQIEIGTSSCSLGKNLPVGQYEIRLAPTGVVTNDGDPHSVAGVGVSHNCNVVEATKLPDVHPYTVVGVISVVNAPAGGGATVGKTAAEIAAPGIGQFNVCVASPDHTGSVEQPPVVDAEFSAPMVKVNFI